MVFEMDHQELMSKYIDATESLQTLVFTDKRIQEEVSRVSKEHITKEALLMKITITLG